MASDPVRSETEFDVFMTVTDALRGEIETCINEKLVKLVLDLNYEVTTRRYPRFQFKTLTDAKRKQIFNSWIQALEGSRRHAARRTNNVAQLGGIRPAQRG